MNSLIISSNIRKIFILFFLCGVFFLLIFVRTQDVYSASIVDVRSSQQKVIEHLRIEVPTKYREAWLAAEQKSWGPWLATKKGFIARQLLWDPKKEEATLLITWSSREKWKNIPQAEIDDVQENFEQFAREFIGSGEGNPFPLVFEGELLPQ